ncbi:MAG: tetratricopeptide repeat protein [Anaerolineales bacterium]
MSLRKIPRILLLGLLLIAACSAPAASGPTPTAIQVARDTATAFVLPTPSATATIAAEQLVALGLDASNRGEWEIAIELLNLAIAQDSQNAQAFLYRGTAYKQLGDSAQALSDYDQAIVLDINQAAAFHSRALLYSDLGNTQQALADFARAIELAPTFGLAYRNRAAIHLELGSTAAAALDLQIYLTFAPNAPDKAEVEAQIAELQEQTVQAANEEGLLFLDDFSDSASGWYTNGDPANLGLYAGDGYVLRITQSAPADGAIGVWAMPGRLFGDVRIEVTARKQSGSNNNFLGLVCRLQGTSGSGDFYAFIISSDGYYGITKRINGGVMVTVDGEPLTPSPSILQGEAANTITAVCSGDLLALYVNGELLVETTDSTLASGQVGLIAGTFDEPTSIFFDDFAVYTEPPQ